MMEQREKLIELLNQYRECLHDREIDCNDCDYKDVGECFNARLADYLLNNGVVVPVRCEDCEYHDNFGRYGVYVGADVHYCNRLKFGTRDSEFCSYGEERKRFW